MFTHVLARWRARLLVGATVAAVAAALAAVPSATAKHSASSISFLDLPYDQNTIPLYTSAAKAFQVKTGVSVTISQATWDVAHSKFLSLLAAHRQPDVSVFGPKWLPEFIRLGVLQPLDSYFPKSFLNNFPKSLLNQVTINGHLWALPEALSTRLMYYRTDLFKQAGIAAPPKTWTEFVADAKKLTTADHYGFCVQGQGDETIWYYTYFLYGAGGRYTNAAGNWAVNQPANVRGLQFEADLTNKYKVTQPNPTGTGLDTAQELLVKGKCAMYWGPPWILAIMQQQNPKILKDIAITDYPTASGKPAPLFIQDVFVMFKGAKDPTAVADWLKFWSQDKYQVSFNKTESLIPVTNTSGAAPYFKNNARIQRFVKSIPYSISYPVKDGWDTVNTEVAKAVQAAFLGTPAQKALDTAQAAIERQVKQ
ncbi:MAG TPA: sugar ABC transporter substrate-binding protein [Gaiellaceae bacterium]|nr:sugar ABC transporter substrate-binding protein [Gaiellaceae bacterium]